MKLLKISPGNPPTSPAPASSFSSAGERMWALWERALLYDWCLCGGDYSLGAYTDAMTPMFLESWRGTDRKEEAE